jgi:hypothetical protein
MWCPLTRARGLDALSQAVFLSLRVPVSTIRTLLPGLVLLAVWLAAVWRFRHGIVEWLFPSEPAAMHHGD